MKKNIYTLTSTYTEGNFKLLIRMVTINYPFAMRLAMLLSFWKTVNSEAT